MDRQRNRLYILNSPTNRNNPISPHLNNSQKNRAKTPSFDYSKTKTAKKGIFNSYFFLNFSF